jgi:hypothetical protein
VARTRCAALLFTALTAAPGRAALAPPPAALAPSSSSPAASTPPGATGPVSASATAGKAEVTVGEPFTVEVKLSGPPGTSYELAPELAGEGFELRSVPGTAASPPPPGIHRYEATVFALAEAEIPAIPVRYRLSDGTAGETATAPLRVRVASLLPKNPEEQKLADIRGPLAVAVGTAFWVAAAAAVLAAIALIAWLVRRRLRQRAPTAKPAEVVPPDVEAVRELSLLAPSGLLSSDDYRAFYIRLTAIAKRYLERRLNAPVLEMTTAETLAFLRGHPHGDALLKTVREVAEAADRIKFARGDGLRAEAARHLEAVRALVGALESRLAPPAEKVA